MKKQEKGSVLLVVIAAMVLLSGGGYVWYANPGNILGENREFDFLKSKKEESLKPKLEENNKSEISEKDSQKDIVKDVVKKETKSISFLNKTYKEAYTFPATDNSQMSTESYEWVSNNEDLKKWTTLITTHKISPKIPQITAESYIQTVADNHKAKGALIYETSVINQEDAVRDGIDIKNPPYLVIVVYVFQNPNNSILDTEISFQKVQNIGNGKIGSFIYGERKQFLDANSADEYLYSEEFSKKRTAIIFADFPY